MEISNYRKLRGTADVERGGDASMGDGRRRHQSAHIPYPVGAFARVGPLTKPLAIREWTGKAGPRHGDQDRGQHDHLGRRLSVGPKLNTAKILKPDASQAEEEESLDLNRWK